MSMMKIAIDKETKEQIIGYLQKEIKEMVFEEWTKIMDYINESQSQSTQLKFTTTINCKQNRIRLKTQMTASQILKASREHDLGEEPDPNQPEFEETTAAAPGARAASEEASDGDDDTFDPEE